MNATAKLDTFLRRHPLIFLVLVFMLTVVAAMVLLGAPQEVGLIYKAF